MILSTMAFACMNGIIKYLVHFPTFELVFFRSLGSLFLTAGVLRSKDISFRPNRPFLLIFRGILGVTSMSMFFAAAHYIPIGSAVTIRYISPLFAAVLAVWLLRERVLPLQWLFYFLAFVGVVCIKGFDAQVNTLGVVLAILAAFFSALVYLVITKIGDDDHPLRVVFFFMLIAVLTGFVGSFIFEWLIPNSMEFSLLLLLGIFGYFGQLYMTKAFQQGQASSVAPVKYVEVIFTLGVGIFIFDEVYPFLSLLGMFLIVGSLTASVLYKNRRRVET